jgi:hypothetical protein
MVCLLTISFNSSSLSLNSAAGLLAEVDPGWWTDALGDLCHYLYAITGIAEHSHVACIPWIIELLDNLLEFLCVLQVTINQARLRGLGLHHRRGSNSLQNLLLEGVRGLGLALLASEKLGRGRGSSSLGWRGPLVIVHALHVVSEIPMAWEAISGYATLAAFVGTKVGLVSVSMHGVGFTLMTKKTGRGRETGVLTKRNLAFVWFQVGVHEFASREDVVSSEGLRGEIKKDHTRSCT